MELLELDLVALETSPDEVDDERKGLRHQLSANYTDVSQEDTMSAHVVLVDVETGQAVSHFLPLVECHNFHVVSLIARLHKFEQSLGVVE